MPEATVTVRWPDGRVQSVYSPSLVVHDHLRAGAGYRVAEFVQRTHLALDEASERVRARYGMACTAAAASQEDVRAAGSRHDPDARVTVLDIQPPLPEGEPR
ncbi:MSMEG_0570 family nitrogen starvation response protein [Phycicoccus sp. CSK15P-2]|uniref:MSMEG_0570 family nitrogen starvation response protein n=1 Tax=Phycicoccus sp. CSK15P-2 TaxID=2807627 RepID=UPI0019526746|nr:MSMEG_0570 family nitrogen starvation response protein [Phycicoccus sp. CSK15P-2]MBM6402979.1 MSMEG_0570 family nitrogen starvation response protein [Phycicoccus sp. CSK15P-2]